MHPLASAAAGRPTTTSAIAVLPISNFISRSLYDRRHNVQITGFVPSPGASRLGEGAYGCSKFKRSKPALRSFSRSAIMPSVSKVDAATNSPNVRSKSALVGYLRSELTNSDCVIVKAKAELTTPARLTASIWFEWLTDGVAPVANRPIHLFWWLS
jgi:hypothetical protein